MKYFLGTFETNSTGQFTSATGTVQSVIKKEDSYAGKNTNNTNFRKDVGVEYATSFSGAWFYWDDDLQTDWFVMIGDGVADTQFELKTNTDGLKIVINGTTYTGEVSLVKETWYFILVEFVCHDSTGSFKVFVNSEVVIEATGIDSKTGTDTGIRYVKWQGTNNAAVDCYVDNCLFTDDNPNYVFKVSKVGKDVSSMDIQNLLFHSSFPFFKFHDEVTGSFTVNAGDTSVSDTNAHSLGYVPAFIGYVVEGGRTRIIARSGFGPDYLENLYTKIDSSNTIVGVELTTPYLQITTNEDERYHELVLIVVGDSGAGGKSSAVRFDGVTIVQGATIVSASLEWQHVFSGGIANTKMITYGIDEDDTAAFTSSPLGRPKTTASKTQEQAVTGGFFNFSIDVKTMVQEIVDRGGWSTGNAMGFIVNDNASASGDYLGYNIDTTTVLTIQPSGSQSVSYRVVLFKDQIE